MPKIQMPKIQSADTLNKAIFRFMKLFINNMK